MLTSQLFASSLHPSRHGCAAGTAHLDISIATWTREVPQPEAHGLLARSCVAVLLGAAAQAPLSSTALHVHPVPPAPQNSRSSSLMPSMDSEGCVELSVRSARAAKGSCGGGSEGLLSTCCLARLGWRCCAAGLLAETCGMTQVCSIRVPTSTAEIAMLGMQDSWAARCTRATACTRTWPGKSLGQQQC